jgi:sigma-54 dependent transcriptional regulator, acetoin dehydrogenase operon transcriptional activator AcoR
MNEKFVSAFTQRFGQQPISREMAASYDAIHLLSSAYRRISGTRLGGSETEKVRATLKNISFHGIQGKVIVDPKSQHLWQWSRIGRVNSEGRIETLWESPGPVPPRIDTTRNALVVTDDLNSDKPSNLRSLVGTNKRFLECVRLAEVAARTSCNVLITGDTGTGKELVARRIHEVSSRSNYPFVAINCTAIPRELIESELFGYEEGSFTGAKRGGKMGKFEMANGGTLFLDEIGDMACDLQTHLLRAIEEKEICRIGGSETKRLDVRLIASTNKDLSGELGRKGGFRKDLFFRLSVFHIELPNLCDRIDDIPLLADHFLQRLCYKSATKKDLAPDTLQALQNYKWPGNVRELSNVIERAFYLSLDSTAVRPENLPVHIFNPEPTIDKEDKLTSDIFDSRALVSRYGFSDGIPSIKDAEERLIRQTLARSGFNISRTASLLGISRTTLYRRIRKYEIKEKAI